MSARAFVSLGSNHKRELMIGRALATMEREFGPLQCSSFYESEAVAKSESPARLNQAEGIPGHYLNAVVVFETAKSPTALREALRNIEEALGRNRALEHQIAIDLDLLLYVDAASTESPSDRPQDLPLPHPDILRYEHTLRPLVELAGEYRHPHLGQSLRAILEQALQSTDFAKTITTTIPAATITDANYEQVEQQKTEP